jgi:hypothetical protein
MYLYICLGYEAGLLCRVFADLKLRFLSTRSEELCRFKGTVAYVHVSCDLVPSTDKKLEHGYLHMQRAVEGTVT